VSGAQLLSAVSGSTFFKPPALPEVTDFYRENETLMEV
jgi:hypothetical protein